jgi:hypothetical protein
LRNNGREDAQQSMRLYVEETVMRPLIAMAVCAGLLAGCTAQEERVLFDGHFFKAKLRKADRQLDTFTIAVRPVSKSLRGAREAGAYEATVYCVNTFGTSDIVWTAGPDAADAELTIANDTLLLQGRCPDAR